MANQATRWAISLLSRQYKDIAQNQEFLANKDIGLILNKTAEGNIMSYDYMTRLNTHLRVLEARTENLQLSGNVYSIEVDHIETPDLVEDNMNLLDSEVLIKEGDLGKILLSIDMDCVEIVNREAYLTTDEPSLQFIYTLKKATLPDQVYSITLPLSVSVNWVFEPTELFMLIPGIASYHAYLTSVKVIPNSMNISKDIKNILHSMLIIA